MVVRVVSGGQTGVDRAALDVALTLRIPCGGWCPRGRQAEDGRIDPRYPLQETPSRGYVQRTEWNVRDSDGTLVLNLGRLDGGTAQTVEIARWLRRPCLVVDLARPPRASAVRAWMRRHRLRALNVAGPRESKRFGIYEHAREFLRTVLD